MTPPALPRPHPDAPILPGRLVDLERLDIARHASGLWLAVGRDAKLWAMIPPGPFADEAAFTAYLASDAFHAAHTWPDHAPIDSSRLTTYRVRSEISGVTAVD